MKGARAMSSGDTESPLRYYLALEGASREMLEAARSGDWDTVCRLEGACAVVIARLRRLNESQPLSEGEQPERLRILRAILVNDAEIRRIAGPEAEANERERGWPGPNITLH